MWDVAQEAATLTSFPGDSDAGDPMEFTLRNSTVGNQNKRKL